MLVFGKDRRGLFKPMNYSLYCDESCHLLNDGNKYMVLGCVWCPTDKVHAIHRRIRDIKCRAGYSPKSELKWTKLSNGNKRPYEQLIDYFFDDDDICFRAVIIDKTGLNHDKYDQTHEEWYYKMLFLLIHTLLDSENTYKIFLDYKDSQSGERSRKLHEILCSERYDFDKKIITNVQCLPSKEIGLIQLCDVLIGSISYDQRQLFSNKGKIELIQLIKDRSRKSLKMSTLPSERKLNLFFWHGGRQ